MRIHNTIHLLHSTGISNLWMLSTRLCLNLLNIIPLHAHRSGRVTEYASHRLRVRLERCTHEPHSDPRLLTLTLYQGSAKACKAAFMMETAGMFRGKGKCQGQVQACCLA